MKTSKHAIKAMIAKKKAIMQQEKKPLSELAMVLKGPVKINQLHW